jgi:hypothetical protein
MNHKTYLNGKELLPFNDAKFMPEGELVNRPGMERRRNPASGRCHELKTLGLKASSP